MSQSFDHIEIGADPDPKAWDNRGEFSPAFEDRKAWRKFRNVRSGAYVSEGYFISRHLRFTSQYRDLPMYSSAITALATNPAGNVFGATSGENAHVFVYNPVAPFDAIAVAAKFDDQQSITAMVWEKDRDVIVGTRTLDKPGEGYGGGVLARITTPNLWVDTVQEWPREGGEKKVLCTPVAGEGIADIVIDRERNVIYGISDKTSMFFRYDLKSEEVKTYEEVCPVWHHSQVLMMTGEGKVMAVAAGGVLVEYDPEADELKSLEIALPAMPGRSMTTRIDTVAWDAANEIFYLGDQADGLLIAFDPETLETCVLGKPTGLHRIRALAVGVDGRVFGMAGGRDDMGQFFVYDPDQGELKNLGIPMSTVEEKRYGLSFASAVTGRNGEIYLGEDEVGGRLFVYFPSQRVAMSGGCSCCE